ncbi:MAG: AmmeMemoRadiSam system protein A [Candidatus Omnitrophica bacterium]|nr:AmmeMemoRadiSam system protein A [Candidatus Omnitrophota bacterium]
MPDLSSNSRKTLLHLAREAIRLYLEKRDSLPNPSDDPALAVKAGCFVTLHKHGALRGCVGTFESNRPLSENVIRMATAAAFQDTRFPPVDKSELNSIRIEISILGALKKMESISDLVLGTHGVYVKYGWRSGTFLPQVAVEQKWSKEEFITWCAREKAGLKPAECAKAEVYIYEVEKFGEEEA